jgi:glycosyltransferase involved in cell wall biosynthesis
MSKLKICVNARIEPQKAGGVSQFIIGLASGLSQLTDGEEEYHFLVYPDDHEWLRPYLQGNCRLLPGLLSAPLPCLGWKWKVWLKAKSPTLKKIYQKLSMSAKANKVKVAISDGTIERAGMDLMHFTIQEAFLTGVPSIYHPHDLQHLHLPQFFSPRTQLIREVIYRTFCQQAQMVSVASSWTKNDLIQHYQLPEDKVQVIPLAPLLTAYPNPSERDWVAVREKFSLPQDFIFYPAQTWEHKNHLGLLEALTRLRHHDGLIVPLVSSGAINDFFPNIERRIRKLQLNNQVQFLGFVTPLELQCLYRFSRAVVISSKFEAASFPLWEAFLAETPAACSNVTSLPDQAGDAALLFNPDNPEEIAQAVKRLWTDPALRRVLVERGKKRVCQFTWDRTARHFRAHYRRLTGRAPTVEDRELLSAPPLL